MAFPDLKINAVALPAYCTKTRKMFGIRTEEVERGKWLQTWAFPISEENARREKITGTKISGEIYFADSYNGCPYCGATGWYECGHCGAIGCNDEGAKSVTCPKCGKTSNLVAGSDWNLSGGGY